MMLLHAIEMVRQGIQVLRAFFVMGYRLALSYPLSFAMHQLAMVVPVVTFYFVARLIPRGDNIGGDYFTFVVLGLVGTNILAAGLQSFGRELDQTVQQGQFEMLLTEPTGWRLLPIGLATWPVFWRTATSFVMAAVAIPLGAHYRFGSLPLALLIVALGAVAGLAIGILSGSVRVLAKHSDPILALYTLAASVLAGVFFPIHVLPAPLQWASWALPHTYMVNGLRAALLPDAASISGPSGPQALLALAALNLVLLPVGLWLFGRSLDFGRKVGVLAGY